MTLQIVRELRTPALAPTPAPPPASRPDGPRASGQRHDDLGGKFKARREGGTPAIRERVKWNAAEQLQLYSGLMLAVRITLAHFSVSSAINTPNSVEVRSIGVVPTSTEIRARRALSRVQHSRNTRRESSSFFRCC
jgi:hypothetical protein